MVTTIVVVVRVGLRVRKSRKRVARVKSVLLRERLQTGVCIEGLGEGTKTTRVGNDHWKDHGAEYNCSDVMN